MNIAIIPARSGSKRIKKKNIRTFIGKPIICHVIETAIKSNLFDDVIVSSDDSEIIEIAKTCGASAPFVRPNHLSDDFTGTAEVINHALLFSLAQQPIIRNVCCIYPTAVFIKPQDLCVGLLKLDANLNCDYVFTASEYPHPIERGFTLNTSGKIDQSSLINQNKRTQDLVKTYHDAGQWYWGRKSSWLENKPIFSSNSECLILPKYSFVDIDTEEDWQFAEKLKLIEDKR